MARASYQKISVRIGGPKPVKANPVKRVRLASPSIPTFVPSVQKPIRPLLTLKH